MQSPRFQVDAWAETYAAAKALAQQAREAMEASADFEISFIADRDRYEDEPELYRVITDFTLWSTTD